MAETNRTIGLLEQIAKANPEMDFLLPDKAEAAILRETKRPCWNT